MRFLTDVNASGALAEWLTEMGHEVVRVTDRDPRMPDDEILKWALTERRVIVTTDKDFEEMVWREAKAHCGLLRLENLPRLRRRHLLDYVLTHHENELKTGAVVVALETKIRVRRPHLR